MPTEVWAISTKGRREGKFSQKTSSVTDFLEELQTTMPIHSCGQLLKYVTDTKWVVFFVMLYKEIYCSQANCIIVHCHYGSTYTYIYLIVRDLIVLPIQSSTGLLYAQISQFKEIINTTELEHSNYQPRAVSTDFHLVLPKCKIAWCGFTLWASTHFSLQRVVMFALCNKCTARATIGMFSCEFVWLCLCLSSGGF